jgi:hypothetical protein
LRAFMDDFSISSNCQETHLDLNKDKCHFMVREKTVLGH